MRKIWLILLNAILLVLATVGWFAGQEELLFYPITVLIVLSFPLNLLVGWLFFVYGDFNAYPGMELLFAVTLSVLAYVQWFELVPRIAKYFSRKFSKHDRQIEVLVTRDEPKQIPEGTPPESAHLPPNWYDKEKYSPVERVFNQK